MSFELKSEEAEGLRQESLGAIRSGEMSRNTQG
jgi:hypothetical protein